MLYPKTTDELMLADLGRSRAEAITCEYVGVKGAGCPKLPVCVRKCYSCFRGIGHVVGGCFSQGSGQPADECRCYFSDGAPCVPECLRPPPASSALPPITARTFYNGTHVIIGS